MLLCVYLCVTVKDLQCQRKGNTEGGKNGIHRTHECKFVFKRGKKSNGGTSVKVEHRAYDKAFVFVCVCVSVHVFTSLSSHWRERAENEIKGKQVYWWSP